MADLAGRSYMYLPVHVLLQPCPKHPDLPSLGTNFYLNRNRLLNNMYFTGQHFVPFFSCPDKENNAEKKLIGGIKRPLILPVFCTRFRNFLYLLVPLTPPVLDQLYLFRLWSLGLAFCCALLSLRIVGPGSICILKIIVFLKVFGFIARPQTDHLPWNCFQTQGEQRKFTLL